MFARRSSTPTSLPQPVTISQPPKLQSTDQLASIIQDIELIEKLFKDDRVMESYALLKNIEMFSITLNADMQNTVTRAIGSSPVIAEVRYAGDQMTELLQLMSPASDAWNIWNSGIGAHQDITVEGIVEANMFHVVAALIQNNLYSNWLPLCIGSETLKVVSPHRRIIKSKFDLSLVKKEASYTVYGDVIPEGGVMFTIQSLLNAGDSKSVSTKDNSNHNYSPITIPTLTESVEPQNKLDDGQAPMEINGGILLRTVQQKNDPFSISRAGSPAVSSPGASFTKSSSVKSDVYVNLVERVSKGCGSLNKHCLPGYYGTNYSEPLQGSKNERSPRDATMSDDLVNVSVVLKVDPHLGFIPDWIFNMAIRSSISTFIPMLQHAAKQFDEEEGGAYCSHMDFHSQLYNEIRARLTEYKCM